MSRTKSTAAAAAEATPAPQAEPEATQAEQVTLTGRLTADPILRRTQSGIAVTNMRIAVNHEDGTATFHSVVAWKRTAEVVAQYLTKGRLVEVTGRPQERARTDNEGNERTTVEINAFSVQFLSRQQTAQPAEPEVA
jgi:single-strand DNA-binding protein